VTAPSIVAAVRALTVQMGEAPSTGDLAAALNVSPSHARQSVTDAGPSVIRRVGRGPGTRLVVVEDEHAATLAAFRVLVAKLMQSPQGRGQVTALTAELTREVSCE
jgi:hypothetical protein